MNHARTYPTRQAAESTRRFLAGGLRAAWHEPCGGWHLEAIQKVSLLPRRAGRQKPFPPAVAARIDARDIDRETGERCCQRCSSVRQLERHHRRLKGIGGARSGHAQCACNSVTLCRDCHRLVHGKGRVRAEAEGFIVSQSADVPGTVSVMRFAAGQGGAAQWPSCGGEWASTADESSEAVA